jgi:hypothetical protein
VQWGKFVDHPRGSTAGAAGRMASTSSRRFRSGSASDLASASQLSTAIVTSISKLGNMVDCAIALAWGLHSAHTRAVFARRLTYKINDSSDVPVHTMQSVRIFQCKIFSQ